MDYPEDIIMNFEELFEKYQILSAENTRLKKKVVILTAKLNNFKSVTQEKSNEKYSAICLDGLDSEENSSSDLACNNDENRVLQSGINNFSNSAEKIRLFMSLFKGRNDVYAKRWENKKKGTSGYSPVCLNEWKSGVCRKPIGTCMDCHHKLYATLDEIVIDYHLRGHNNFIAGIYPMCLDETCYFLAIDFDDGEWQKDISALRDVCGEFNIPITVERSRSGKGAHAWFFFEHQMVATLARKFGTALLTYAMTKRHEITFKSYDRLFPNQDTMPKGRLGNLIALPLQKEARKNNNSEFIDENFESYKDQWAFLAALKKLSEAHIEILIEKLCAGNELGILKKDEEEAVKPWERNKDKLLKNDFPQNIEIVKANMIFIPKAGISQKALNYLKRLAAFKNPEFYKAQAMRLPTGKLPRIISCSEETKEYLCLPRGCAADLEVVLKDMDINFRYIDKTNDNRKIDVEFNGHLRDEQPAAIEKLLQADIGVLSGTTAFGKTVVAIKLIAERKVNTLILVDKISLVAQWKNKLLEFLTINESLPDVDEAKKRGKKRVKSIIGQLGGGKDDLNGVIDIAVMQSLYRMGEVKECVNNYGMIIVDECHHVSAFSFEKVLKSTTAKYVYGLTATPVRKDGHHPIIFMQCGTIRYRDDAKKQAQKRPFEHYVIPRFTSFRVSLDTEEKDVSIQELYTEIVANDIRNELIIADVVKSHEGGRNCLVLTERTAHVELIAKELSKRIPNVISLVGGMGAKETREILQQIADIPVDKQLTLVATGKYIGEGFDEPRLDTLFLAMPISWKGTLQQYAGRLHRLFAGKNEAQIYDYVDIYVKMLEKMYNKRLTGYAAIGYKAKGESTKEDSVDIIFDKSNFLSVFINDIITAVREILIVSPFVTKRRSLAMLKHLEIAIQNKVRVIVVTRPAEDFKEKDIGTVQEVFDLLKSAGVSMVFKSNIHQKFAIVDQKIVWYGSINLLSFGNAEESIMRLESSNISNELVKTIEMA
ncbi:MAG: DEAD/DEAH box helicase family protein [Pelosinus sp.]|nr:DEAD/DEAH box helicase family protein [Pelosinus sp.]